MVDSHNYSLAEMFEKEAKRKCVKELMGWATNKQITSNSTSMNSALQESAQRCLHLRDDVKRGKK